MGSADYKNTLQASQIKRCCKLGAYRSAVFGCQSVQRRLHAGLRYLQRFVPHFASCVCFPRPAFTEQRHPLCLLRGKDSQRESQPVSAAMCVLIRYRGAIGDSAHVASCIWTTRSLKIDVSGAHVVTMPWQPMNSLADRWPSGMPNLHPPRPQASARGSWRSAPAVRSVSHRRRPGPGTPAAARG